MSKELRVIEQKNVLFYEDEIMAVRTEDGNIYVPVRPICELLGLSWPSQSNRIKRDAVLSTEAHNISLLVLNAQGEAQRREMLCLPLDFISGFLFGVDVSRTKPEIQAKLIKYQKECYKILSEAFFEGRLTADSDLEMMLQDASNPVVQAYQTFQALAKLARQQLILESRVNQHEERLEQLEAIIGDTKQYVTPSQASQISQAVKAIALELGQQTKKNEYGGVYGELYRRFEITSYKFLPKHKFEEAMLFLTEWYKRITGKDTLPF
jgi:hypothetical protein